VLALALVMAASGCVEGAGSYQLAPPPEVPPTGGPAEEQRISLLPDGQLNHLLPVYVGIDHQRRRLFTSCNALPTIAEIDLVEQSLVRVHTMGDVDVGHARPHPDGDGVVWLTYSAAPTVMRLEPTTGDMTYLDTGLDAVCAGAALDGGGLVVAGVTADTAPGHNTLLTLDGAGGVIAQDEFSGSALSMLLTDAGELAVLFHRADTGEAALFFLEPGSLDVLYHCTAPNPGQLEGGLAVMAELPDGGFVASQDAALNRVACDGDDWGRRDMEPTHRDLFVVDDEVLVLGRTGTDEAAGANWGIARRHDVDLEPLGSFATGKNSGFGRLDPASGLIWLNSEGTNEVWGMDPGDGSVQGRVRLGEHVESLAVHADRPGRAFFTGRLGNAFGWVDFGSGEVAIRHDEVVWPVSPVHRGDTVWMLAQLTSALVEVETDTLEIRQVLPTGLPENTLLTFGDLAWHPDRASLFVSHAQENALVEVDPVLGEAVGRWELPGEPITDRDKLGCLEVLVVGDHVITLRNTDGRLGVVDPDAAEIVAEAVLDLALVDELREVPRREYASLDARGPRLYVGGFALDVETLARQPQHDLDISFLITATVEERLLAWRHGDSAIVVLDGEGMQLEERVVDLEPFGAPAFAWTDDGEGRLVYTAFAEAQLRSVPLADLIMARSPRRPRDRASWPRPRRSPPWPPGRPRCRPR